jgi:hypothetical protein
VRSSVRAGATSSTSSRQTARDRTRSLPSNTSDGQARRNLLIAHRIAAVLLSLWAGSIVAVCAFVAPTLFALLERRLAGQVAARLFFIETVIGVVVAIAVFVAQKAGGFVLSRPASIAIVVGALAPLSSELILGPMMQAARSSGDMARFGALHGVSALLFGIACVSVVLALWFFNRPAA